MIETATTRLSYMFQVKVMIKGEAYIMYRCSWCDVLTRDTYTLVLVMYSYLYYGFSNVLVVCLILRFYPCAHSYTMLLPTSRSYTVVLPTSRSYTVVLPMCLDL